MRYPNCKNCVYNNSLRCVDCNWGSEFEEKRTSKERMAELKLALANAGSTGKKLVGSIMDGYSYVDTDVVRDMSLKREALENYLLEKAISDKVRIGDMTTFAGPKGSINVIYEPKIKKEERNMKVIDIYNLTKNNGLAAIVAGGTSIPVRITNVEHETGMYTADTTTLTCEVQGVPAPLARRAAKQHRSDLIKNVYFNAPVTVVIWADGSKTIVKANGEEPYDPEKGLAMAIAKKFMGDNDTKSNYYDVFKKWLPKPKVYGSTYMDGAERIADGKRKTTVTVHGSSKLTLLNPNDRWKIWVTHLNPTTGETMGYAVYPRDYATKYSAERAARRVFGTAFVHNKWIVSQTNPWETEEK